MNTNIRDLFNPETTYIALPVNFNNRSPIAFKGQRRAAVGTDHSNDNYRVDANGIDNCWPFDWNSIQDGGEECLAFGRNDNCGTSYQIFELDDFGRYKLADWLVGRARKTLIKTATDQQVIEFALQSPDSKFIGDNPERLLQETLSA